MRTLLRVGAILLALAGLGGCAGSAPRDTVTQVSTIDALLAGAYDGQLSVRQLLQYGDTGIGTFDKLDGEMVLLDGVVYQVRADGKVYRPPLDLMTPFAAVVHFRADRSFPVARAMSFAQFEQAIDRRCPNKNTFYAIRARGTFARMKTRSVPAQKKPYPALVEVAKRQPVFEMTNVSGRLVGFRCPPFVKGINVPGYHLHFITDDQRAGGHVLDFAMKQGHVELDVCNRFVMLLPHGNGAPLDLSKDRAAELEQVEKEGRRTTQPAR